ncbi:MAG TPA: hypothetical protein VFO37_11335, partial [Chitinophagaceae bacterium]|nr:hypothetical protein [Chitinophagaceae bacterium]
NLCSLQHKTLDLNVHTPLHLPAISFINVQMTPQREKIKVSRNFAHVCLKKYLQLSKNYILVILNFLLRTIFTRVEK